jgi:hypothetical protein
MEQKVFGRLTVVTLHSQDANYNKRWLCQCTCGNTKVVLGDKLKNGNTKSCGCFQKKFRENLIQTAAVERRDYTKSSYSAMLSRCYNPKTPAFPRYGGAGIGVCARWRFGENGLTGWDCFRLDMGPRPQAMSIDRINNELGYTLENCRWATNAQQQANRRRVGRKPKSPSPQIF